MINSINMTVAPKNDAKKVGIGAAAGTAIGAGAGVATGLVKANSILAPFKNEAGKLVKDSYVNSRIEANMDNIQSAFKKSKWAEKFTKIAEKAGADFDKAIKTSKNTKIKWAAGLAAAGLAIGAAVGFVANKIQEKNSAVIEKCAE